MLFKLFLCFTLIPAIELYLLIKVGSVIGGLNTILLVVISGFIGAWLARLEGINTLKRLRLNLEQGLMPTEELLDAIIILIAGIALITPGFITDVLGILLLWSITRNIFKKLLRKKINEMILKGNIDIKKYY